MAIPIKISDEFASTQGRKLYDLIVADIEERDPVMQKLIKIRSYYYGDIMRKLRYAGQPNLHLPIIAEKVEGFTRKAMGALYGADPFVNVMRPYHEVDPERTRRTEVFIGWAFENDIVDSYRNIQRWIRSSFLDGPSVIMPYYMRKWRKGVQSSFQKKYLLPSQQDLLGNDVTEPRAKLPIEILVTQFGDSVYDVELTQGGESVGLETEVEDFDGLEARLSFIENRVRIEDARVIFANTEFIDEVELSIHRKIMVFNGVMLDNVEFEDIILPYRAKSIQEAERVTRQYWLTITEIQAKVDSGEWDLDEEDMASLRAQAVSERQQEDMSNRDAKQQRDMQVGETSTSMPRAAVLEPFVDNKVLIFEVYLLDDADDDGEVEEVIYQIPAKLYKIARADYLESVFPHGRRPFPALHGVQIDDRWYSLPIAQWLLPINEEVDIILNQTHEAQETITNPFFFYEPMAFGDVSVIQNGLYPGMGVPVANAKGIMIPTFPQQPLANLQAIDSLLLFADRLTIAPQSMGSSQVRNAPRTARGTLAIMSEASANVDSFITEAQQGGWKELVHQVHALYQHYGPDEKFFWVTGKPKPESISREDLSGKYEYIFRGNSTNTNKEVRRSISQLRFQTLAGDPQYLQDPAARLELIKDFLRHNSEGVNIERITPNPQNYVGNHPPMSQEAENESLLVGEWMDVLPGDNHAEHLRVMRQFMTTNAEKLQQWQITMMASHNKRHMELLAMQQQAGQITQAVPGAAGASQNVPQLGGELSGLEGGVS